MSNKVEFKNAAKDQDAPHKIDRSNLVSPVKVEYIDRVALHNYLANNK